MAGPKYTLAARELVRALRGRRSQAHLSRRLGYRSNALHTWEVGTAFPAAHRVFALGERVGVDLAAGTRRFFRDVPPVLQRLGLSSGEGITALLGELKGRTRIADIARGSGLSRFSLSRWLSGQAQPNLPDLLCFVDHTSLRLLDFIAVLVDPAKLPSLAAQWAQLQAARDLGYRRPDAHAVLRALETATYRAVPTPTTLSDLTGLPEGHVMEILQLLCDSGQVTKGPAGYVPDASPTVDFRRDPLEAQALKAHWARVAAERTQVGRPGLFAYNVFAIGHGDLERLIALQRAYLREMRRIIADSEPSDTVALANFQIFSLAAEAQG